MMKHKFEKIIAQYEPQLVRGHRRFDVFGYVKILAFIIDAICLVFLFASSFVVWAVVATAAFFGVSIALWWLHERLYDRIRYMEGISEICRQHITRIDNEWASFADTGSEFIDAAHPYASDLDIVGAKSFFQFLNTTKTWHGRQAFARDLLRPSYEMEEIHERQAAIAELASDIDFANDMQFYLSRVGVNATDVDLAHDLADSTPFLESKVRQLVICYLPFFSMAILFLGAILQVYTVFFVGIALLLVQPCLCKWGLAIAYLGIVSKLPYELDRYVRAIDRIAEKEFVSTKLAQMKAEIVTARDAVKELEKIVNKQTYRSNPLLFIFLNWLLLWDAYCAILLQRWKAKHSKGAWLAVIGEFESLLAFSHLKNVCEGVCLPKITQTPKTLTATALGHPLLANSTRVCNNVHLSDNIFIISGSNMSGKTTFMRTIGVNLLLARAGGFVCAESMTCSCFDIATSMRLADDLTQGVSTFYAELKRIKMVLEMARDNERVIFLIDEIFRGTNSVDRLAGAEAVLTRLDKIGAVGMISTHDIELCKLAEKSPRVENFSFCEIYQGGQITFDYKIHAGRSVTTNARFLMQMVGI